MGLLSLINDNLRFRPITRVSVFLSRNYLFFVFIVGSQDSGRCRIAIGKKHRVRSPIRAAVDFKLTGKAKRGQRDGEK